MNHVSDDEDDTYESPEEDDPNNLVSPRRPHQSPSASPRALLRPDPPPVPEVLADVNDQLRNITAREARVERRNAHRQAQEVAEAAAAAAPTIMVNFDREDGQDGDKAAENARHIKVEFAAEDIIFWFAQLEDEMTLASIKSQWMKKTVLQRNLPNPQKEDVKSYLTLQKEVAGNHIYLDIKTELIRIYAAKPDASYRKALTRTMVGLPSQLGYQILNDVCKKANKMNGCCCAAAVQALWVDKLPASVRAHISDREFSKDTYKQIFEAADKCYTSQRQITVAAVSMDLDETVSAFDPHNQPQVAAFGGKSSGKPPGKGKNQKGQNKQNKNNKPEGQGGGTKTRKRHESMPPEECCDRHYVHGASAWYCLKPSTCPWFNKVTPK